MNISLTPQFERLVNRQVKSGRYASASEVVREGLRLIEEREVARRRIQQLLKKSLAEAERGELLDGEAAFAEIERSLAARAQPRRRKAG